MVQGQVIALSGTGHRRRHRTERAPGCAAERPVRRSARLPRPRERWSTSSGSRPSPEERAWASLRRAPPRMARLCATPGSFPHVDAASSRVRSSSPSWWSGEAGSALEAASAQTVGAVDAGAGRREPLGVARRRRPAAVPGIVASRRAPRGPGRRLRSVAARHRRVRRDRGGPQRRSSPLTSRAARSCGPSIATTDRPSRPPSPPPRADGSSSTRRGSATRRRVERDTVGEREFVQPVRVGIRERLHGLARGCHGQQM